MKALIQAGGAGTRLKSIAGDVPKPMVKICGKPILQYQIENLKRYGISDISIVVSKTGNAIKEYFGDGSSFDVHIDYIIEESPLGTGGAIYYIKNWNEDFILLFGDLMLDIDWGRFINFHKAKGSDLTPFVHPNSHPYDSDLVKLDQDSRILGIDSKNNIRDYYYQNITNAGLYICSKKVLEYVEEPAKIDFEKNVLNHFIELGNSFAYKSSEYVKDCGTPDRYYSVTEDVEKGIVKNKNLGQKQKCIFLDRDGTLNVFGDLVKKPELLELKDDVADALKFINKSGYLAICVTNQPVVARGDVSFEQLTEIHNKLHTLLGEKGAYLDALYFCPHHPHKGYKGEVPELKMDCECRKPKPGMLLKAAEEFNIDLSQSWMIGDTARDVLTGHNAGCKSIFVTTGDQRPDEYSKTTTPDYEVASLSEALKIIFN